MKHWTQPNCSGQPGGGTVRESIGLPSIHHVRYGHTSEGESFVGYYPPPLPVLFPAAYVAQMPLRDGDAARAQAQVLPRNPQMTAVVGAALAE